MKAKKEKSLLPWRKPAILNWGAPAANSPAPANGPLEPVGHSFIPHIELPAKLPDSQALTAAFEPVATLPVGIAANDPQASPAATPVTTLRPKTPEAPPAA